MTVLRTKGLCTKVTDEEYATFERLADGETLSDPSRQGFSATHPAVGAKPGRATWTNTALPRPAIRGRVLWSISMMKS